MKNIKIKTTVTGEICGKFIRIYINGLLHWVIDMNELVGFQSWVNGRFLRRDTYKIEATYKTTSDYVEYTNKWLWVECLTVLESLLNKAEFNGWQKKEQSR